jgi:hypothetical protein
MTRNLALLALVALFLYSGSAFSVDRYIGTRNGTCLPYATTTPTHPKKTLELRSPQNVVWHSQDNNLAYTIQFTPGSADFPGTPFKDAGGHWLYKFQIGKDQVADSGPAQLTDAEKKAKPNGYTFPYTILNSGGHPCSGASPLGVIVKP